MGLSTWLNQVTEFFTDKLVWSQNDMMEETEDYPLSSEK